MTANSYGPGNWATQPNGVYGPGEDTERITVADHQHVPAHDAGPDWDGDHYQHVKDRFAEASRKPAIFMPAETLPSIHALEGPNTPTWNRFDTFLRRGTMAAAFILLWTFIVMGILTGAAIVKTVGDLGQQTGVNDPSGLWGTDEPLIPRGPDGEPCRGVGLCD